MLYFAYGSNMHPGQMQRRCPGARAVGPASLLGWQFIITTRGTANIVPHTSARVHGVLWVVTHRHVADLDRWEGISWRNYLRRMTPVTMVCGTERSANVYVSARHYCGSPRADYLHGAVLGGAEAFELPEPYIAELRRWCTKSRPIGVARGYRGRRL